MVHVERQPQILQVVVALHPPCRLAGGLDGRQQKSDHDSDDRDHHEEFNEREPRFSSSVSHLKFLSITGNDGKQHQQRLGFDGTGPQTQDVAA
jgi:hypothetical protein